MPNAPVYIVDARRSGQAPAGGVLSHCRAEELLAQVAQQILAQNQLSSEALIDWAVGCAVQQDEQGMNLARQAALWLNWNQVPGMTLNRMECSGLEAVLWGQHRLTGESGWLLAGGCEKMSVSGSSSVRRFPHPKLMAQCPQVTEPALLSASRLQKALKISREALDQAVIESHRRAVIAQDSDYLAREILRINWKEKVWRESGWSEIESSLGSDEGPREDLTHEHLSSLESALGTQGILTAAHLAPPSDGAALCLMASEDMLKKSSRQPLGKIVAWALNTGAPWERGSSLANLAEKAVKKAGLQAKNIQLVQVSETTSVTALAFGLQWSGDPKCINVNGGSLAFGNSMAASGVCSLVSMLHELRRRKARHGLVLQDASGGQHLALVIEAL